MMDSLNKAHVAIVSITKYLPFNLTTSGYAHFYSLLETKVTGKFICFEI